MRWQERTGIERHKMASKDLSIGATICSPALS